MDIIEFSSRITRSHLTNSTIMVFFLNKSAVLKAVIDISIINLSENFFSNIGTFFTFSSQVILEEP